MATRCCFSFENKRKLFEIHASKKFALVVAARDGPTSVFPCSFYLHDDEWLFGDRSDRELVYSLEFIRATGDDYLNLLELRSPADKNVAEALFSLGQRFLTVTSHLNIKLTQELNMTYDADEFLTPVASVLPNAADPRDPDIAEQLRLRGFLTLHEGKTFHQFSDRWEDRPRYVVQIGKLSKKVSWVRAAFYYRLAFRDVASSTNERTIIFAMLPPAIFGNTAPCDRNPHERSNSKALVLAALTNTFCADWTVRIKAAEHVNLFILNAARLAPWEEHAAFFSHAALRLSCNHCGYEQLWEEQVGNVWRESVLPRTWPVIADQDLRWSLRAAIDAAVAHLHQLTREQYVQVLSLFSHKGYPDAPALCLARFDELASVGFQAFTKKYDPYWDIPLNEAPPRPVIELLGAAEEISKSGDFALSSPAATSRRGRRGR
jgi:hypothetical protein